MIRKGLLVELVKVLQLRRAPLTPVERKSVRLTSCATGAKPRAWRRLLQSLMRDGDRGKFPRREVKIEELNLDQNGSDAEVLDRLMKCSPSPPVAKKAPVQDEEGTSVGPLVRTALRVETLREMGPKTRVAETTLPFLTSTTRGGPPSKWGRGMKTADLDDRQRHALRDLLEKELKCGSIERVTDMTDIDLITPIHMVESGGRLRLIHDCRALNATLQNLPVKYSSVRDVAALKGKVATKLDLVNAFKHVGVVEADRASLCFTIDGTVWRWTTLNFGMSVSPALYARALEPALAEMRSKNIRFISYVDDFLVVADDVEELDAATTATIDILERHGWSVSKSKTFTSAHSIITFLGLLVNIETGELRIPPSKAAKLKRLCSEALSGLRVTRNQLQKLVGLINFFAVACPVLGALSRGLTGALAETERTPGHHVWRRGILEVELRWWACRADELPSWEGPVRNGDAPFVSLVTDASANGVGGLAWRGTARCPNLDAWVRWAQRTQRYESEVDADVRRRRDAHDTEDVSWAGEGKSATMNSIANKSTNADGFRCALPAIEMESPLGRSLGDSSDRATAWPWLMAEGLGDDEAEESSAVRELLALVRALSGLAKKGWFATPTILLWTSDSQAATRALTKWRSRSTALAAVLDEVWRLCRLHRVEVRPEWVDRESGWLPGADWLSRVVGRRAQAEWAVPTRVVDSVLSELGAGRPDVDYFASRANRRARRFRSRWPEEGSEGPALARPWDAPGWAFPPFGMAAEAVRHWLAGPRHDLVLILPVDDRGRTAIEPAAKLGLIRRATAPWRVALEDEQGVPALGQCLPLRGLLLSPRREPANARLPGPMK